MFSPGTLRAPLRHIGLAAWSSAYRLAEAELGFATRLPSYLARAAPNWPVAQTVAVDVGASVGVYSRAFCRWCPRVIAVEPNADLANHLRKLALPCLSVVQAAAGAKAGNGTMSDDAAGGWRHPTAKLGGQGDWQQPCRILPLSDIVTPPPSALVVKIDVEGDELAVVRGMGELFRLPYLLLIVEVERRPMADPEALFDLLFSAGFGAWQLRHGRLHRATPQDVPTPPTGGPPRLARLHGYRNNFIFRREQQA